MRVRRLDLETGWRISYLVVVLKSSNMPIVNPVKILPSFYGTRRLITVFTVHTFPPYLPKIHSNVICLPLCVLSRLFLSCFPTKTLNAFLASPMRFICVPPHLSLSTLVTQIVSFRDTKLAHARSCIGRPVRLTTPARLVRLLGNILYMMWRHRKWSQRSPQWEGNLRREAAESDKLVRDLQNVINRYLYSMKHNEITGGFMSYVGR
jgi:hypothetical protein